MLVFTKGDTGKNKYGEPQPDKDVSVDILFFELLYLTLSMKVHIMRGMNKLPVAKRAQILSMLCEGASMRSVSRLAD